MILTLQSSFDPIKANGTKKKDVENEDKAMSSFSPSNDKYAGLLNHFDQLALNYEKEISQYNTVLQFPSLIFEYDGETEKIQINPDLLDTLLEYYKVGGWDILMIIRGKVNEQAKKFEYWKVAKSFFEATIQVIASMAAIALDRIHIAQ